MRADIERAFASSDGSPLRRAQPEALKNDGETQPAARAATGPTFVPKVERRKAERRGMDALRDEALRNLISRVEDRNFGGLRTGIHRGRGGMKPSRIVLLLVAMLAGGTAAFLAMQRPQAVTQPAVQPIIEVVQEAKTQILVAKEAIGIGQRLSPASVEWAEWPQGAMRPEYITVAAAPGAITDMTGSVARFEFFPGEPIREQKLARPGQGYLSAVLDSGMRAVSVSVAAESASGGFIVPNDHADVVLTIPSAAGKVSETILHNVRVLAINDRLGEAGSTGAPANPDDPRAEIFAAQAIVTLELDPTEAEVIISASALGSLSLVLRSLVDFPEIGRMEERPTNAAIRISSPFWSSDTGDGRR
jgi:pilus assembly protein CpaB